MVNIYGLTNELAVAGITIGGCNSSGKVWDLNNNEIQDRGDVAAIIAAHDESAWRLADQRTADRLANANTIARNIPGWSTWSQAEFQNWCDSNLMTDAQIDASTLSAALKINLKSNNAFVRNAGKMVIAMRDQTWPDIPEG